MNRVKLNIGLCPVGQEERVSMSMDQKQRQDVTRALDQILQSSSFVNSAQLQNFLQYIVTMTLEGRASDIKGYTIGVDALGKDESFDPTTDPSVRVMAGRLRQALTNFYIETPDHLNPRIELPKGKYVPVFDWAAKGTEPAPTPAGQETVSSPSPQPVATKPEPEPLRLYAALGLSIAALGIGLYSIWATPVSNITTGNIPEAASLFVEHTKLPLIELDISQSENGLPDWISPELARSRTIVSFSRFKEFRFAIAPDDPARAPIADYKIEVFFSTIETTQDLVTFINVKRGNTGEIIWSRRDLFPEADDAPREENRRRASNIVSQIMSPYGIIHGDIVNREFPPPRLACIKHIYEYFYSEDLQTFSNGLACAKEAIESETASSSMYAMLAFLKVEAHRRNIASGSGDPLVTAREYADQAVRLDEANARALQAQFAVEKASGNRDAAIAFAERAIAQNPFDRDIIGDFAAYLISIEELERAREPLETALELSPLPPAWLTFYHYLFAEETGDLKRADGVAGQITPNQSPLLATALLLAAERNGETQNLMEATRILQNHEPGFLENPEAEFLRRGFAPELASRLSTRLKRVTSTM